MTKHPELPPEIFEYAKELAQLLGETEMEPVKQVRRIVKYCGIEFSRELYKTVAELEDQGGMMLPDNSRRRTRGGIFFYLTRMKVDEKLRAKIFPRNKVFKSAKPRLPLGVPLLSWKERIALIQSLQTEQGEIKSMKVLLTGRPGRVEKRPEVVVTTMSDIASLQNLPRGIPIPSASPTVYTVYMNPPQWERIEASLADPADTMTVEGVCAFDPETNGMAVFAHSIRSEFVQAKMREEQSAAAAKEKAAIKAVKAAKAPKAAADKPTPKAAADKPAPKAAADKPTPKAAANKPAPKAAAPSNSKLPPEVARKLSELYASASLFRQKLTTLRGKPAGQQFGLDMTQKLLKNVEDEIAALEKKYKT